MREDRFLRILARLEIGGTDRDQPGPLSDDQLADALITADVAARAVLAMPVAELAAELEGVAFSRVHQASGMVAAQLDVDVAEALVRLRAHAFAHNAPLAEVAKEVVARRLRFD